MTPKPAGEDPTPPADARSKPGPNAIPHQSATTPEVPTATSPEAPAEVPPRVPAEVPIEDPAKDPAKGPTKDPTEAPPADERPDQELAFAPPGRDTAVALTKITTRAMAARLPHLLVRAMRLAWKADPRALVALMVCQVLAGVLEAGGLLATTGTITALISSGDVADRLRDALPSILLLSVAVGVRAVLGIAVVALSARVTPRLTRESEWLLLQAASRAELAAYNHPGYQDRWDAADRGLQSMRGLMPQSQDVIAACASLIAAASVLTLLHPVLLPLLLLGALPRGVAAVRGARVEYLTTLHTQDERRLLNMLRWHISDQRWADQLRAGTMAPFLLGRYAVAADRVQRVTQSGAWTTAKIGLVGAAVGGLAASLVWAALAYLLSTDRMSVAAAGTAVIALRTVGTALGGLVVSGSRLYSVGLYLDDWARFLDEAGGHAMTRGDLVPKPPVVVRAENVTYRYPGKTAPAVADIDLELRRGTILALVGENGSGKSTLSRLLCGLYLAHEGRVTWNGDDVGDLDPHAAWSHVGYVPQEIARWPLSARLNINLGQPREDDDEAIGRAAGASGADDVIAGLPRGLGTLLAREWWGGVDPSVGQWQRFGIARALYGEPGLICLDEPTSALDPRAEHRIFAGLREIARDSAVVLVTHRLANVAVADHIVVMDSGRVIQQGTFDELLAQQHGLFAELWRLQQDRGAESAPRA
ncbi:ATP-binding cassette domain-containing protein [Embleya hyalina]|uniref:ABC transporter n=1 Tax=Embleya hyalina TaxID=516124 RepID=A0A401YCT1_9ACTN|nr:ATP-binding cassette domain-containing protein [Embleya hyalina]GCD92404.1 ABC transporter [Embleya hyalina]